MKPRPSSLPRRVRARSLALLLERLEDRTLLSGTPYLPPTYMLINRAGLLSGPAQGQPLDIAMSYLTAHAASLGMTPADLQNPVVTDQYRDPDTGITHIYLRQTVDDLEVQYAELNIHLTAGGEVIAAGGGFVPALSSWLAAHPASAPALSATEAARVAAVRLGLTLNEEPALVSPEQNNPERNAVVSAPTLSLDNITTRLHYVPTEDGGAALAWQLIVRTPDGQHWYDLSIDASSGSMVAQNDWVEHASYNVIPPPNE